MGRMEVVAQQHMEDTRLGGAAFHSLPASLPSGPWKDESVSIRFAHVRSQLKFPAFLTEGPSSTLSLWSALAAELVGPLG